MKGFNSKSDETFMQDNVTFKYFNDSGLQVTAMFILLNYDTNMYNHLSRIHSLNCMLKRF